MVNPHVASVTQHRSPRDHRLLRLPVYRPLETWVWNACGKRSVASVLVSFSNNSALILVMKNQTTAPSDDTNGCSTLNDLFTLYGFVCGSTKRQSGHKTEEDICESSVCLPALKAFLSDPFEKLFETATTWSDVWDCFLFSVFCMDCSKTLTMPKSSLRRLQLTQVKSFL